MRTVRVTPEAEATLAHQLDYLIDHGALAPARALKIRVEAFLTNTLPHHPGIGRFIADRNLWESWIPGTRLVVWYTHDDHELVAITLGTPRKTASVPSEEQKQHAKRQPTIRRLSPDERHVGDGQRPGIAGGIDGLWLDLQCSGTHVAASDIVNSIRAAAGYSDRAAMPNWLR